MAPLIAIEKVRPLDLPAILAVTEFWNMHQVPSPEMDTLDLKFGGDRPAVGSRAGCRASFDQPPPDD